MSQVLTFHNDKKIKAKYVARVKLHHKLDEIIKGRYWRDGKGCCVGCIVEVCENPHKQMLKEIGTSLWLNYLVDRIFENLPNGKSKDFPLQLIQAIPVGINLQKLEHKFLAWLLENVKQYVKPQYTKVLESINHIIDLHLQAVEGKLSEEDLAWSAAESAAWSAARSAESAESAARSARSARSAAWSAARSAAESAARSAAESAESAAWSARSAAESAAESAAKYAAYIKMADKLIELLKSEEVKRG